MNQSDRSHSNSPIIEQLALAVDSHGWEDFPSHLLGEQASEILACWTAMWHPALLHISRSLPQWQRIDLLPEEPRGWIVLVPTFSRSQLVSTDENRFTDLGGRIVYGQTERSALARGILQELSVASEFSPQVEADLYSLGYCYLQVQLMTRQLRYTSSLDEDIFKESVMTAVKMALSDDPSDYEAALQRCFDQLTEERSRYYPTTANLLDYVFLTSGTIGKRLSETLRQGNAMSFHASGETVDAILKDPGLVEAIRQKKDAGKLSLVGGENKELPGVLLSAASTIRELEAGVARMEELLPGWQKIYARRTFGLRVGLPAVLERLGFDKVVHCTLDDGIFPQTSGNHIRWEGDDGTTVDALVAPPKLASAPETWLNLGVQIGEVIDINQYASLLFVHWPGDESDYYRDLVNSCRFGAILGNFVPMEEYFENLADPGFTQNYLADDYRDPYLKQMIAGKAINPVSRFVEYWRALVGLMSFEGMTALSAALDKETTEISTPELMDEIHRAIQSPSTEVLTETPAKSNEESAASICTQSEPGCTTLVNPLPFRRRVFVPVHADIEHPSVLVSDPSGAVVEVPSMGFVCLNSQPGTTGQPTRASRTPSLAEDVFLRNELMEVEIDERTGGIGAVKLHGNQRTNLIAQQIAWRETREGQSRSGRRNAVYSQMVCERVSVALASSARGEIVSEGVLKVGDQKVASFRQTTAVTRAIPVIEMEIELTPVRKPVGGPWHNYYACRFAWNDEMAKFHAWQNESRHQVVRQRIVAPMALEIDQHDFRTTILTNGLPFHQRIGDRRMDSLMMVSGEQQTRFRIGIGVNLPYPYQAAMNFTGSVISCPDSRPAVNASHAWLFHLNCKNVVALNWRLIPDRAGLTVLLKETEGRRCELKLACCRDFSAAWVQTISGECVRELTPDGHEVTVPICAHEMIELALFW